MSKIILVCLLAILLNACTVIGLILDYNGIKGTHENPSLAEVGADIDSKLIDKITGKSKESKGGCDTLSDKEQAECFKQAAILMDLIEKRKNKNI